MPKVMERKVKRRAKTMNMTKERQKAYVYGPTRKTECKPKSRGGRKKSR